MNDERPTGNEQAGELAAIAARITPFVDDDAAAFDRHFADLAGLVSELGSNEAVGSLARRFMTASDDDLRGLGLDLLAAAIEHDDVSLVPELLALCDQVDAATGEDLRWSAAHALAAADDVRVLDRLLDFAADPDSDIRWQVAYGIPSGIDDLPERAVAALIALMSDDHPENRDWATFTLAVRGDNDSPAIRAALIARLQDDDETTAAQAITGLALRGDNRGLSTVGDKLLDDHVEQIWVESAVALGDPILLPALERLKVLGWGDDPDVVSSYLDDAIDACRGEGSDLPGHDR